jgi:hypothetical protein
MGTLKLSVDRIEILKRRDLVGKDEPYLWVFGICVPTPAVTPVEAFVITTDGRPGNLGDGMRKGDARAVPAAVGRIETDTSPIAGRILVAGLAVMAWERDFTDPGTIQIAYRETAKIIDQFIIGFIPAMLAEGAIRDPNDAEMAKLRADVEGMLRDRFKASLSMNLPWSLNLDDFIGLGQRVVKIEDAREPFHQDLTFDVEARGTHWRLTGAIDHQPEIEGRHLRLGRTR